MSGTTMTDITVFKFVYSSSAGWELQQTF
jgi:hypothetical protein